MKKTLAAGSLLVSLAWGGGTLFTLPAPTQAEQAAMDEHHKLKFSHQRLEYKIFTCENSEAKENYAALPEKCSTLYGEKSDVFEQYNALEKSPLLSSGRKKKNDIVLYSLPSLILGLASAGYLLYRMRKDRK